MRCCVSSCNNTSENTSQSDCITFHSFPSQVHLRAAWLRALGKPDSHLPDTAVVCSQHFLNDDIYETECGLRQIVTGAIPSTVQVCMICLDTDCKLILISKHKLEETYEKLTGHPVYDQGNLKLTLCVQCAQRLINFSRFRDKSLRARALMMDLVDKHELITLRHIKMINRTKHQLKSGMVLTMLGPDHCDLHILEHPLEDKQTEIGEIGLKGVVKTEENDDSMSVDVDVEVIHEEDNNVNDFVQNPLKYESATFQCTFCLEECIHEHAYMQHMSMHLTNGEGDGECDTTQVCKSHTAVSSSSSHSSLVTENKHVDLGPSPQAAQISVAPVSALLAINNENKVHTTEEADAETFKRKFCGLHNTSGDSKMFTNCVVRLCDIFKAPRQDQALRKTRKSVSGIQNTAFIDFSHQATSQNEVPTTEYIEPVTNSRSRVKVTVTKTLQSKTDGIHNIQCNNSSQYSSHTAESSFICDICGNFCNQQCLLVKHVKTNTEDGRFTCNICQYKCKFKSYLKRHMITHTRENSSQYSSHTAKGSFICDICGRYYKLKILLVKHIKTHSELRRFTCKICQHKFKFRSYLARHMRTHTRESSFTCSICDRKFANNSNLVYHMSTHTGENKSDLVRNIRIHTGEKPYSCNICERKFVSMRNSLIHMTTHTGIKPYACKLCEYKTAKKSNVAIHMRTHTGEKPYCCRICEYKCAYKRTLASHMTTHTGDNA